jgi:hypothetical protein
MHTHSRFAAHYTGAFASPHGADLNGCKLLLSDGFILALAASALRLVTRRIGRKVGGLRGGCWEGPEDTLELHVLVFTSA